MSYRPNPAFDTEIRAHPEHREGLRDKGEDVVRYVEPLLRAVGGPWMPRKGHRPVEVQEDAGGVYVALTGHGGHLIEYGSANNPPHAPLRRGARAAGLDVDET